MFFGLQGEKLRRLGEFGPELDHAVVGDLLPIHRRPGERGHGDDAESRHHP